MDWFRGAAALLAISSLGLTACRKSADVAKSDLKEAGYGISADDWFRASRENDVAALKQFAAAGFRADSRDAAGNSALHAAAAAGARDAANYLLDQKLPVDLRGESGRTPLMEAVVAGKAEMAGWLLRQGADASLKDSAGFKPLMLAVREGKAAAVQEIAPYDRADLDPALLLAALVGRADVIDALTNFGASVYARMDDGRTPLMIAAENGHEEAVKLLLEIGASRFTTDAEGRTAADIATAAGHPELAEFINRPPAAADMVLDSPAEIAGAMDTYLDEADAKAGRGKPVRGPRSEPIQGRTLSKRTAGEPADAAFSMPPLVMRHYREKDLPVRVRTVRGEVATLGIGSREVQVRAGDRLPGSRLVVVRVRRRMEDSKVNLGQPSEISVVEVRDTATGQTREWTSGIPATAHDPVALVEDTATGKRYVVAPGQRFEDADGGKYLVSEVRPDQVIIQDLASREVRTIRLHGPRG